MKKIIIILAVIVVIIGVIWFAPIVSGKISWNNMISGNLLASVGAPRITNVTLAPATLLMGGKVKATWKSIGVSKYNIQLLEKNVDGKFVPVSTKQTSGKSVSAKWPATVRSFNVNDALETTADNGTIKQNDNLEIKPLVVNGNTPEDGFLTKPVGNPPLRPVFFTQSIGFVVPNFPIGVDSIKLKVRVYSSDNKKIYLDSNVVTVVRSK